MSAINNNNPNYSGFNLVICNNIDKTNFISYIINEYKGYNFITYNLNHINKSKKLIQINNKKQLKYKKSVIFSNINSITHGFSLKAIGKFKTPIFCFVSNFHIDHIMDSVNKIKNKFGQIIISPFFLEKSNDNKLTFIKYNRNQLETLTDKYRRWIVKTIHTDIFIDITSSNEIFKNNNYNINDKYTFDNQIFINKPITIKEEELVEYFIENPIIYDMEEEISVFF